VVLIIFVQKVGLRYIRERRIRKKNMALALCSGVRRYFGEVVSAERPLNRATARVAYTATPNRVILQDYRPG